MLGRTAVRLAVRARFRAVALLLTIGNYRLLACYDHFEEYSEVNGVGLCTGTPLAHRLVAINHTGAWLPAIFSPFNPNWPDIQ